VQKESTRRRLLDAAQTVLRREGLAGATTRRIALEASVSSGTFFVHFPDVQALVQALLDDLLQSALAEIRRLVPTVDVVADLVEASVCLFDAYDREPELAKAYLRASLFHKADGLLDARLVEYQSWVSGRLASQARMRSEAALEFFAVYFSLYFSALLAGLRGELDRSGQRTFLTRGLQHVLAGMESLRRKQKNR
jgi:AcrR family transcriptional regulator